MPIYNKYVELGRVVFIAKGKDEGKLAVIVDVVDGNKVIFCLLVACNFRKLQSLYLGPSFVLFPALELIIVNSRLWSMARPAAWSVASGTSRTCT